ncbi:thioesterase II family protein [Streptomyces sp. LN549]|uniref:thioesterase II family protein n=1 Tax=Streptomyces sp. LN549 TaxID=3112979 RepID=UPI0037232152
MTRNLVTLSEPGRTQIFLLPFAGGSASSYWSWSNLLPAGMQVSAAQLPGRQDRWQEPPYRDFGTLVGDLADEITELAADGPYVLLGHSLGATIAYETARELQRRSAPDPALLVISAAVAPQIDHDPIGAGRLSDDELIDKTREAGRLPAQILESTELLELVLPALRADLALVDSYRYLPGALLSCPVSVFGGRQDPQVPVDALGPWQELTTNRTALRVLDGDHFYLWGREAEVAEAILTDLSTGPGTDLGTGLSTAVTA